MDTANKFSMEANGMVQTKPLTEWKKEPSVMDLKADLEIAKPSRDTRVTQVQHWLNLRNIEGSVKPKQIKGRSQVQPKLIRRQNEWRYSAVSEPFLSSEKLFKVSPVTWEDKAAANQNEMILNWQMRTKLNRVKFIDQVVRTFVDEGTAVIRVGWIRNTEIVQVEKAIYNFYELRPEDEQQAEMLAQALEMRVQNYNEYLNLPEILQEATEFTMENERPVFAEQVGTELVEEEKILDNRPTAEIVDYPNFYLDPAAEGDVDKATFAVVSYETSKAELLKDGRYSNLEDIKWANQSPLIETDHETMSDNTTAFKDDLRKRVVAYEYWGWYDIEGNETLVPIVATWVGNTMIRMEKNPYPDQKIPFVVIPYLPVKKSVFGEPDAELLSENQAILGAVTRGMVDLLGRSANGQTGFSKDMLDAVNRRRYESGQDYEFNPNKDPRLGVHQHSYPDIPASAMNMLALQNQDAESLTGVKAFSGGLSGEAYGDVASGIRGMLDAASKREMAIVRRLAQGIKDIGDKFTSMNAIFLSEEEVIRVTNDEFVSIRREDLEGEFDLAVDISTAEVEDAQAQDLTFMLQTMGNTMDFNLTKMILGQIAKLKRMPDLAKLIEQFEPQPDPIEQALREAELQKVQMEIQVLQSEIMVNQAKARETSSGADLKDLEFLETETGTKHARDIDRSHAQAQGNQAMKITEGILKQGEGGPSKSNIRQAVAYDRITQALTDRKTQ